MGSLLSVDGLTKRFGGLVAVREMEFSLGSAEILGLIGPNGSGKSTTLSLIMGVVRPDGGTVRFRDRDIRGWPTPRVASLGIRMVFQHSRPLPRQTVLENVRLALLSPSLFQKWPGRAVARQAEALCERVGLSGLTHRYPASLAFADVRRLELAKAIACGPEVILLDEPFAGLAPAEVREFTQLIVSLREEGRAILLVDHNVKAVSGLVDRMVAMHAGTKIAEGTPAEVIADSRVREVYLGAATDVEAVPARDTTVALATEDAHGARDLLVVELESAHYGKARALAALDIKVREGEFVSVVGLNGAGKSTLLKAVMGFVEYDGDVRWMGASCRSLAPATIARQGLAMCPETRELFWQLTVKDNLALGGRLLAKQAFAVQLERVFELFPILRDRQRQSAATLSGGEQQQLTIGRAMMQDPRLLILDEPTLGLAPLVIQDISVVLKRMRAEFGLTVLLAEQNLTFALRHSDRIYLLETGEIVWSGGARDLNKSIAGRYL